MKTTRNLILFAKAPRIGAVKTRLATDIGMIAAWRFHKSTMTKISQQLGRDRRWSCRLFVTPDRFAREGRFWPAAIERRPQGPGDLGARMDRALHSLPCGPVVLIGVDIPEIEAEDIARAFRLLERASVVFGPATDGGFWLIGARRRRPLRRLFENVRWSGPHALADSLANLDKRHRPAFVRTLDDIDDGDDYRRWRERTSL